jgi:serine/threonine protein kinase
LGIKCPKCRTENPDTQKFCGECATLITPSKEVSITKTLQTPVREFKKDTDIAKKYKIIEKLGEGGMGVVYKAKDTRLKRTVALKFLPAELTRDKEAKKRFIQEAQAAAALEHPNICTVYEVDEADGQTFIAMSYIEGQSLKDKLKDDPMDIDEAKVIALQVAEGLKEAHEKGIVHRDIKSANIMLTEKGQAKITDFGLAKLSWGIDLTKTSTIMGTIAYMSPEQAKGEEVDHRADIWSLGAMLYEMLTGERPFKKDQEQALIYAILNDKPTPLSLLRSDIPTHLERVIEKSLEKKARDRYQDIQELIQDLELSITSPKTEKSIVVLPFDDMSPGKDNEYFSDGLTEEIISDLSLIHDLLVISRSSAMTYKGTKKKIKEIGKELNVQYVLEGSVRKAGNNLRITAQLIDAQNDTHLWAEKYSGTLDDVFDIQEKVSKSIVDSLKIQLSPDEQLHIDERPIENVQAYECYLKANYEIWRFTEDSIKRAIQLGQEAMDIIGQNELLITTMGMAYFQYVNSGIDPDEKNLDKAEAYAQEAFKLNPDSTHGHVLMSLINETRGNFYKAIKEAKKALELDPNNAMALLLLGCLYSWAGKPHAAKPLNDRVEKIDPLNPINLWLPWWIHISEGRFDLALEISRKMYERDRENPAMQFDYVWAFVLNHQNRVALETIDRFDKDKSESVYVSLYLFIKYALKGDKDRALKVLTSDAIKLAKIDHIYSWFMAQFHALLGLKEEAIKWLENTINRGRIDYPFLAERDPLLENIRDEPQFKKLMERVKHEWENFEV